ncbi:uncharacterized protein BJ212DRAFT_1285593, partial [Suillus subaureus]
DDEIGDGTTGVVNAILTLWAGALLEQSKNLLDHDIHPIHIADSFDQACAIACKKLNSISDCVDFSPKNKENLPRTAITCLGSKMCASPFFPSLNML